MFIFNDHKTYGYLMENSKITNPNSTESSKIENLRLGFSASSFRIQGVLNFGFSKKLISSMRESRPLHHHRRPMAVSKNSLKKVQPPMAAGRFVNRGPFRKGKKL
jgi:hypothetical protein